MGTAWKYQNLKGLKIPLEMSFKIDFNSSSLDYKLLQLVTHTL